MKKKESVQLDVFVHNVPDGESLNTVEDTARRLVLGVVTVKRLIKRGELRALQLGHNTVRVPESAVKEYLASRQAA
jgi:excisionase family DNA binding protein